MRKRAEIVFPTHSFRALPQRSTCHFGPISYEHEDEHEHGYMPSMWEISNIIWRCFTSTGHCSWARPARGPPG